MSQTSIIQQVDIQLSSIHELPVAYEKAREQAIIKWEELDEEYSYDYEYSSYTVVLEHVSFVRTYRETTIIANFNVSRIQ